MQEHLRVPLDSLVELLIRHRSVLQRQLVRHDERRLGASADDQITQIAIVSLDYKIVSNSLLLL